MLGILVSSRYCEGVFEAIVHTSDFVIEWQIHLFPLNERLIPTEMIDMLRVPP